MLTKKGILKQLIIAGSLAGVMALAGCSGDTSRESTSATTDTAKVHQIPAGADNSGFLKLDYSKLHEEGRVDGNMLTYSNPEQLKRLPSYLAIVVDPVEIYVDSSAGQVEVPDDGPQAVADYFERALKNAVAPVYRLVEEPGPLVLRLRSAVVGVAGAQDGVVSINSAIIEIELRDSETGEVIAAVVDKETLGAGAVAGGENLSREEKFRAAADAFDQWAMRVRDFLDAENEIEGTEDEERVIEDYRPYGS